MLGAWVLLALAAGDWKCDYAQKQWGAAGVDAPCVVVTKSQSPQEQLDSAMKRWALTEPQARCAIAAIGEPPPGGARSRAEFARWRECVERWPEAKALWVGMIRSWDHAQPLDALVAKLPAAPVDGGTSLAEELLRLESTPASALSLHLLETQPQRLGALLDGRGAFETALTVLELRRSSIGAADWLPLARALVDTPLQRGDLVLAADLWMELPESARALARSQPLPEVRECYGKEGRSRCDKGDQRAKLALGLIVSDRKEEARLVPLGAGEPLLQDLVAWHLTGKRSIDSWEAAIAAREIRGGGGDFYTALFPFIAPHQAMHDVRWLVERGFKPDGDRYGYTSRTAQRLNAARAKSFERLKALVSQLAPAVDAGVAQPVTLAPAPAVFTERKTAWKGPAPVVVDPKRFRPPEGFWPVRAERQGKRLVLLALSQRLDPVGEVSPGAYWLLLSSNDGDSWKELYLGLGEHRPWHASAGAKAPLLDAKDTLRLVMDEAPIIEGTIRFPPVATQAPTVRENVILEAKLTDLLRDGDHDGLTDLIERRLLLDPANPDTDGDGMKDGDDPTPRLDDRLAPTALAEVYNAFFESRRATPVALVTRPGGQDALDVRRRAADLEDTSFLVGTPAQLGGLKPLSRVVTLTPAELAAAQARHGAFYPMRLTVLLNGNDHAFIEYDNGWSGGTCRIDRDAEGKLVVTNLGSWVS